MLKVMPAAATPPDVRPWRKRHPVISRTLLYGLGLGLAALLFVLFTNRKDDDEKTRIAAVQQELDSLSLVLATDPTGDAVLKQLDERFSEPGLPVITQGRALRWRAMAWRRKVSTAEDEASRARAVRQAEAALEACAALALAPEERTALGLEWAEARLERHDVQGAYAVMPAATELTSVPAALLLSLLRAQALRLEKRTGDAVALARDAVMGMRSPVSAEEGPYVGGRNWTAAQVAVQMANFATSVGDPAELRGAWNRLRAAASADFDVQIAAARGLALGGAAEEALIAWKAARAINGDMAASEARRDPELQALERARVQR